MSSCSFYTENVGILKIGDDLEVEESEIISPKKNLELLKSNNLNESSVKLETETKKIEEEISTLLERF